MSTAESHKIYLQGVSAKKKGEYQKAYDHFLKAITLAPTVPAYRLAFAIVADLMARPCDSLRETAYHHAAEAARMAPHMAGNWTALGEIALNCYKFPEAIAAYARVVEIDPQNAKAHGLMGFAYSRIGNSRAAAECYERAIAIDPDQGDFHFLLSCQFAGETYNPDRQAFHGERGFTAKKPALMSVESCWNAAHGFLRLGCYEKGWNYFEARLRRNVTNQGQVLAEQRFKKPMWRGEKNCRVLIQHEMGFGDTILMSRFLPVAKKMYGVDLQFECMDQLIDLMAENFTDVAMVRYGEADESRFDYHLPMMSLPFLCATRNDSVPWDGAYLRAPAAAREDWAQKLLLCKNKPNIGICWAGSARHYNSQNFETDRRRSLTFDRIKPILDISGINFISLQPEQQDMPCPDIKTFSDTAAIIAHLDGVVSVDTAVANLAGAMGKPVWLMNRFDSCWRWSPYLKTPWYPTVKDIRQPAIGDWQPVVDQIKSELEMLCDKIAA